MLSLIVLIRLLSYSRIYSITFSLSTGGDHEWVATCIEVHRGIFTATFLRTIDVHYDVLDWPDTPDPSGWLLENRDIQVAGKEQGPLGFYVEHRTNPGPRGMKSYSFEYFSVNAPLWSLAVVVMMLMFFLSRKSKRKIDPEKAFPVDISKL
jgi:hypothetical protein